MFFIYASNHEFSHKKKQYISGILFLFILQSLAFFAREIAWAAVIVAAYFFLKHLVTNKKVSYFHIITIISLILAKSFHQIYCHKYQLSPPELHFLRFSELFNYKYLLDFFIKSGFAFNIAWPCVFIYFFKFRLNGLKTIPDIFIAWTIAAVLYIGAAYSHNYFDVYGYPLRISYALFPLIFLFTTQTLTSFKHKKIIITCYLVLSVLINITGVLLDPNTANVTYENVLEKIDIR
jgi:predicted benzoate:H+ symporter BenE